MVVLDATIVNIALPVGAARTWASPTSTGSGWSPRTPWPSAACCCWAAGSADLIGRKRDVHRGPDRLRRRLRRRRGGRELRHAGGGARLPGRLRRAAGPGRAVAADHHVQRPEERGKAFGVFGAIAGAGGAVGLLLGGLLTQYLTWRWCLYVNLFFAAVACAGAMLCCCGEQPGRAAAAGPARRSRPGGRACSASSTASPTRPATGGARQRPGVSWPRGWCCSRRSRYVETRARQPLLPLRIVLNRNRGGFLPGDRCITGAGMFGIFLFLTYYLQRPWASAR